MSGPRALGEAVERGEKAAERNQTFRESGTEVSDAQRLNEMYRLMKEEGLSEAEAAKKAGVQIANRGNQ